MIEPAACLGIDIGGTKIAAGMITASGEVLRRSEVPTPARAGGRLIIEAAVAAADQVRDQSAVLAVGVGTAGIVDRRGRVLAATDLLTDWVGTDVAGMLAAGLADGPDRPQVVVANDVHAHAVGEARVGAGRGTESVLVVAAGTGLGGALVHDGQPVVGGHGAAGHLGHLPSAEAAGLRCSCGRTGHLEAVASGYGLLRLYRSLGGDPAVTEARALAEGGVDDDAARRAVLVSGLALGRALGGQINVVDPELVIISGGLGGLGARWWDAVREGVHETVLPYLDTVRVVPAERGDDAAIIGAGLLAFDLVGAAG